jgi:predicted nucleotidyltransferase
VSADQQAIRERFSSALDALVGQLEKDRSILAAMLCGSLSHDVVWEKSDIDLMLVTVDDKDIKTSDLPIYAEGVNVHALLVPRAEFRKMVEGSLQHSFIHSFLSKGRLLYTHDETIATLCDRLKDVGRRDTELQLFRAAATALPHVDKARKWFVTRRDLDYSALWILYAATPLAQIEVISRRLVPDREVIPQASTLNPAFFEIIYRGLLNAKKTPEAVSAALDAIDVYLRDKAPTVFRPVLDHLREVGEARSSRDLDDHFARHMNLSHVTSVCEYLADLGLLGKASAPVKLTRRSNVEVQELAFYYIGETINRSEAPPADRRAERASPATSRQARPRK